MLVEVTLRDTTVDEVAARGRRALDEFASLQPRYLALDRWLRTVYAPALVGGPSRWHALAPPVPVDVTVTSAQCQLAHVRRAARRSNTELVEALPPRVHIARTRDAAGRVGFGAVDGHGDVPLASRVLALFLADYLMRPEQYVTVGVASLYG